MNDKFTTASFLESKKQGRKITMLTAYDYPTAKIWMKQEWTQYWSGILLEW